MFTQPQQVDKMGRRRIIWLLGVAVLLALGSWELAAHDLTWTPGFEVVTLAPGESRCLTVSFHATRRFGDGVVWVASELRPFVQVRPGSVPGIGRVETTRFTVTIAVPAHAPPGQVQGAIRLFREMQLGVKGGGLKVFADPLPFAEPFLLTINVVSHPG